MELNAGKATFQLPETWQDFSQYSYYSADKSAHLTVLFDSDVQEQSAEDVIQDRLATIKDVMPGFRLERSSEAALFGGRNGRSVTFDTQDADALMRTRLLVVMLAPKQAIVVTAQCSVTGWKDFEAVWNTFVSTFTLGAEPKN